VVMLRYIDNEVATKEAIDTELWNHTGDLGYYDDDGYFYVIDRLKEIIKYNAYQVAPAELEAVLLSHVAVADAAVFGAPCGGGAGELPMACVVRQPSACVTEGQLEQFVQDRVAPFKRLRGGVKFVDAIPKTASGKILRRMMKEQLLKGKL